MIKKSIFENTALQLTLAIIIVYPLAHLSNKYNYNGPAYAILICTIVLVLAVIFLLIYEKKKFIKYKFDFTKPFEWFPEFYSHGLIKLIDELESDNLKLRKFRELHERLHNANYLAKLFHFTFSKILNTVRERIVFYEGAESEYNAIDKKNQQEGILPKIPWNLSDRKLIFLMELFASAKIVDRSEGYYKNKQFKMIKDHFTGIDDYGNRKEFKLKNLSSQWTKMTLNKTGKPKSAEILENIVQSLKNLEFE